MPALVFMTSAPRWFFLHWYWCSAILPQIFPPSWHLLHLHLDIHWSVLEILHLLGNKMQGMRLHWSIHIMLTNHTEMRDVSNGESLLLKQAFRIFTFSFLQARWCTPTSLWTWRERTWLIPVCLTNICAVCCVTLLVWPWANTARWVAHLTRCTTAISALFL